MKKLSEGFEEYFEKRIPQNAGIVQQKETQMAFYAGAQFLLNNLVEVASQGEKNTFEVVDGYDNEISDFVKNCLENDPYWKQYNPKDKKQ